ncbi:MAG: hypothetical protein PF487_07815 [Bacteroidales bacterium]|jgi:hypothetical protein|nr:hypothetical protein [Bacteroidales bacterium]
MQEVEKLAYDFSIQCIGFIKSLNKNNPNIETCELKENTGNVSLKLLNALKSKINKDFSDNLKKSYGSISKCNSLLQDIDCSKVSSSLEEERKDLIKKSATLITKLKVITEKLIY